MSVEINSGRNSRLKKSLFKLRQNLPIINRLKVWRWTAEKVFRRKTFDRNSPLFELVALETRTRCNSACSFCAASILSDKREDQKMPDETIAKVYEELAKINYSGRLLLFVNNEPLLDPRLTTLIKTAKAQIPNCTVEIHSNGLKLNAKNGREILEAGLDTLVINNYSDDGKQHRGVEIFLDEVAPDFPDIQIKLFMRYLNEQLANRGGTSPNGILTDEPLALPCIYPFEYIGITANGNVSICCQDHYFEEIMGNVNSESMQEIWQNEKFQKVRNALRKGDRTVSKFCEVCDFRGYKDEHLSATELLVNRAAGPMLYD